MSQDFDDISDTRNTLLITIYRTTRVIMFQGIAFNFWVEREFPILKEPTELPVSQNNKQYPVPTEQDLPVPYTKEQQRKRIKTRLQHLAEALQENQSQGSKDESADFSSGHV